MSRTLVALSLLFALFATACCSKPAPKPKGPSIEELQKQITELQYRLDPNFDPEKPTIRLIDDIDPNQLGGPISGSPPIGARGQDVTSLEGELERKIREEEFGTIRTFAKAKMPEVDRTPFLEAVAELEKADFTINASSEIEGGDQKFDLWINAYGWDPEMYRAMVYELVVRGGKGFLSATREGKDWKYLSTKMTFENLPSRFTEPMQSWPVMSSADAIRTLLTDYKARRDRRRQLDAERDEAALSSEAQQEREGVLFSVVLQELAETDVNGNKFRGTSDTRSALTIWSVMPRLPAGVSRFDHVAIGFGIVCTGEPMEFRMPNLVIHKRGGASWKEAKNVRVNLSDIRAYNQDGKEFVKPIGELIEGPDLGQFTAKDADTIICRLESRKMIQPVKEPQYFVVVIRIGGTADITALSCDLEATPGNILGTVSGQAQTSGWVVGPMQVVSR